MSIDGFDRFRSFNTVHNTSYLFFNALFNALFNVFLCMNDKFTLEELSRLLASRHRMEETDADAFVAGFFALIEECLKKERYVRIKGLGTFKLVDVEPRTIVDVNSGEKKNIASYSKISFTPEASLRDAVNKPFSHFETVILNENTHFDDIDETEVESSDASDASDLSDLSDSSDLYDSSDSNGSSDLNDSSDRSESEAAEGVEEMSAIENYSNQSLETETEAESESESESKVDVSDETVAEGGVQSEVELESKIEARPEVRAESEVRDDSEVRAESDIEAESEVEFSKKTGHGPIPTYRMEEDPEQSASGKKRFVTPWCMIATVLFVGIIVGGGIVWSLLSGRRYIPEEVMEYISENKILSDTVDNRKSVVRSGIPDTVSVSESVSTSESLSAFETDSVLKSDSVPGTDVVPETDVVPGTYPVLGSDVDSEHKSEPDSSDSEQKNNVKYLTDTVRYKIVGTMGTHTIEKGNTLAKVAYNFYRNKKLWPYIVKHNKDIIKNPDNVPIGTVIKVPMLEPVEK